MPKIKDLMDEVLLIDMLDQGYVRYQTHPTLPLAILNYAEKAVYEKVWNEVTRQCRGLIYNRETREVLARPFSKFFNIGEHLHDGVLDFTPTQEFDVFEKMDGSLGILYPTPDGIAVATRGSFASEQALKATEILRDKYPHFEPCPSCTYLVEIVFPSNRIVVDYGDTEDLVLLDVLHKEDGLPSSCGNWWTGPRTKKYSHFTSVGEVVAFPELKNAEGFVIRFADGRRVKSKFAEYVRLHAIVTNTSTVTVWEALRNNEPMDHLLDLVPDEFRDWIDVTASRIQEDFDETLGYITDEYCAVTEYLDEQFGIVAWERKDFALAIGGNPYRACLVLMHDGKDCAEHVWKLVKPVRELPFKDVAA